MRFSTSIARTSLVTALALSFGACSDKKTDDVLAQDTSLTKDLALANRDTTLQPQLRDVPVDSQSVILGEVGLAGEVRTVSQIEKRVQEAAKLGFKHIILPKGNLKGMIRTDGIQVIGVDTIEEAITSVLH